MEKRRFAQIHADEIIIYDPRKSALICVSKQIRYINK